MRERGREMERERDTRINYLILTSCHDEYIIQISVHSQHFDGHKNTLRHNNSDKPTHNITCIIIHYTVFCYKTTDDVTRTVTLADNIIQTQLHYSISCVRYGVSCKWSASFASSEH